MTAKMADIKAFDIKGFNVKINKAFKDHSYKSIKAEYFVYYIYI